MKSRTASVWPTHRWKARMQRRTTPAEAERLAQARAASNLRRNKAWKQRAKESTQ